MDVRKTLQLFRLPASFRGDGDISDYFSPMVAKTFSSAVYGVNAQTITVEVNVGQGKGLHISGLVDMAVKESIHRVESALKGFGYLIPRNKVVVNLAPADIRKESASYDLPIAISIIAASQQENFNNLDEYVMMGELALDGKMRPIKGVLPIAIASARENFKGLILPNNNAREAAIVDGLNVIGVSTLKEAIEFLNGNKAVQPLHIEAGKLFDDHSTQYPTDFEDVQGQENIKRAFEIAAAGGHNVIMIGPPGAGKTMLARSLPSIMPPLTLNEALETTKIHSVAGKLGSNGTLMTARPYRSPHHTISDVALCGGGHGNPQPGEISLAHNGVLFLDELPEFKRTVLEVMRQPMEERKITISRSKLSIEYPANFMLVASMNPCPCGYYNHPEKECVCGPGIVQKYLGRISGPLLDRIDLHVEVIPVGFDEMVARKKSQTSAQIRERVVAARLAQAQRFKNIVGVHSNAMMSPNMVKEICVISDSGKSLLKTAMERLGLSARAYDRILKVSRTIADLAGTEEILIEHLAEAIQYRSLDREMWASA